MNDNCLMIFDQFF